jgi:hypothetical protein
VPKISVKICPTCNIACAMNCHACLSHTTRSVAVWCEGELTYRLKKNVRITQRACRNLKSRRKADNKIRYLTYRLQNASEEQSCIWLCRGVQVQVYSVNDGPHIRRWSHKIILNIIIYYNTIVLRLPTLFSTVTCCTGL